MNSLLQHNKKGVSEMISYTLLIIIAIGAGSLVFVLFQLYVPKEKPECNSDVSMIIDSYSCKSNDALEVTVSNKGKFNISAAYVRVGEEGKTTRFWLNRIGAAGTSTEGEGSSNFYFPQPLAPDTKWTFSLPLAGSNDPLTSPGDYILEVQAAVVDVKVDKLATCAPVTQTITCT